MAYKKNIFSNWKICRFFRRGFGPGQDAVFCSILFLSMLVCGCSALQVKGGIPAKSFKGIAYTELMPLCDAKNLHITYEAFTRNILLHRDTHRIYMRLGDNLILVDDQPRFLDFPVTTHNAAVIVPYSFKEKVLDVLFASSVVFDPSFVSFTRIKRVIIDPGHGGKDPGAIGRGGLREKEVVLDISKRLRELFEAEGIEVCMTRESDVFIPLAGRVAAANNCGADIFLSIHANANRLRSVKGFEIYYVSPQVSDYDRATAAAKACSPKVGCRAMECASFNAKAILWDMIYTYSRAESVELSRHICNAVKSGVNSHIIGIKEARFHVLRGVRMPGVLIEVGFLSNSEEENFLRNSFYRQQMAESIKEGLMNYARDISLAENIR